MLNPKQDSRLEDLIDPLLSRGLSLRIRATGRSMSPFIRDGEFVILSRVPPTRLSVGDVILFINHAGNLVLHRIISIRRNIGRRRVDSGTIGIDPTGGMDGTVNIDAKVGADETDRMDGVGGLNKTGVSGDRSRPGKSGGGGETANLPADWTIQTKGDAAGVDPPISEKNVLAKVVCVEKFTPFMGFQNLHLESALWKLYGITVVLAVSVKSSALGSFLRPFYRSAKALRNRVFNFSRSGSLTLAPGYKDCPARVRIPVPND